MQLCYRICLWLWMNVIYCIITLLLCRQVLLRASLWLSQRPIDDCLDAAEEATFCSHRISVADRRFPWRFAQSVWQHCSCCQNGILPRTCSYGLGAPLLIPHTHTFSVAQGSSTYISALPFHRHFFDIHLFHTHTHALTSLPHDTSFTHNSSTDCSWTQNSFPSTWFHMQHFRTQLFYTHLRQLLRNSFTHSTFTYNSLQLSVLHHLLCLPRLPSTASTTVCCYGRGWLVGLSGPLLCVCMYMCLCLCMYICR